MKAIGAEYLAGVMDSDGSFSVTKRNVYRNNCSYVAMVQLTWTSSEQTTAFMNQMVAQFGGSHFTGQPSGTANYPNTKAVTKYCATGEAAEKIARFVEPHLIFKVTQAHNIIELRKLTKGNKAYRSQDITDALEMLYLNNRVHNSKNGAA